MSSLPAPKRIVGYSDELSVSTGGSLRFAVSGTGGGEYSASIHRLLGGGTDPNAPLLRTVEVARLGTHPLLDQRVQTGSFGIATLDAAASDAIRTAGTVVARIQPWDDGFEQVVLSLSGPGAAGLILGLDAERRPMVETAGGRLVGEAALPLTVWADLVVSWSPAGVDLAWRAVGEESFRSASQATPPGHLTVETVVIGAHRDGSGNRTRHFAGRIERPALLSGAHPAERAAQLVGTSGSPVPGEAVVLWEFSERIQDWCVPGRGTSPAVLTLHNAPKRGVRGSTWAGEAVDWHTAPAEFGAIHWYPDSLEDCEWTMQFEWTVPAEQRSGFYAAHVLRGDDEDWIPFFVSPRPGAPSAPVLLIASSATYFAYANSRFWWEDPIQEIAQDRLVELGPEEQYLVEHPELGLSNYDLHADDSAVVFSSRLRPNLFMRPGHSRAESYASDLYLVRWLEERGIPYEVSTDEELHFLGESLLDGYRVVLSGSHPEYMSVPMFDGVKSWVEQGGRFMYLGGNGFTSNVTWGAERPWLMENRATGRLRGDEQTQRTEARNQTDDEVGTLLSESGRGPTTLFGVDTVTMGFDRSYPVLRSDISYAPEFAFAFTGIERRLFGGRSLSGGGVIGQEWDNARDVADTDGHYVLASSVDHSLIPDVLGSDPVHHGDVVLYFHRDGVVFSASSMAWAGALHIAGYDNDAERFIGNVLGRFLDPAPLARPAPETR